MITQQQLKSILSYNPDTGVFTWIKPTATWIKPGSIAGRTRKDCYLDIQINGKKYLAHRLAWLYTKGVLPEDQIDHRDLNRGNNQIKNLRKADNAKNQHNTPLRKDNSSGYKGVCWCKTTQSWMFYININTKRLYERYFNTPEEASAARTKAALELHGEFARIS